MERSPHLESLRWPTDHFNLIYEKRKTSLSEFEFFSDYGFEKVLEVMAGTLCRGTLYHARWKALLSGSEEVGFSRTPNKP